MSEEFDPFADEGEDDSVLIERVMLNQPLSETIKVSVYKEDVFNGTETGKCYHVKLPSRLPFYCPNELCGRQQFHDWIRPPMHRFLGIKAEPKVADVGRGSGNYSVEYRCSNCRESHKSILLHCIFTTGEVHKVSEAPAEGAPIPKRLLDLVAPYGSLMIKGYQIEQRGYGIGAFAYYRRIVEQEKAAFLNEVKKVAVLRQASKATLGQIDKAIANRSFERAMEQVKGAVPRELYINNENPFTLLHDILSKGIHGMDDAECLNIAEVVREVLTDFAEKSMILLREPKKLQAAVTAIRKVTSPNPAKNPKP